MRTWLRFLFALVLASLQLPAVAAEFTGVFIVDICPNGKNDPCGSASLTLIQDGTRICGDHTFLTPGAGRMNEGFAGSVRGTVVGQTAVLVITSGRNNGIFFGKAVLVGGNLHWQTLEEILEGSPPDDALVLSKGVLKRASKTALPPELVSKCKLF